MRLLLDEMYPPRLGELLRAAGVDAVGVRSRGLAGAPDHHVFADAQSDDRAVLTENVADFARIAAEYAARGTHHAGLVIAVASRFSRGAAGLPKLISALVAIKDDDLTDRTVYLRSTAQ